MRIFVEIDGILMIEMEYADGGNLAEFLIKQTVRIEEKDILGFGTNFGFLAISGFFSK